MVIEGWTGVVDDHEVLDEIMATDQPPGSDAGAERESAVSDGGSPKGGE